MAKGLILLGVCILEAYLLVLSLALMQDTMGLRNTRVIDILHQFRGFDATVDVRDPVANAEEG